MIDKILAGMSLMNDAPNGARLRSISDCNASPSRAVLGVPFETS
jgi:hypothetical protein